MGGGGGAGSMGPGGEGPPKEVLWLSASVYPVLAPSAKAKADLNNVVTDLPGVGPSGEGAGPAPPLEPSLPDLDAFVPALQTLAAGGLLVHFQLA